jgi:hypothetical protein
MRAEQDYLIWDDFSVDDPITGRGVSPKDAIAREQEHFGPSFGAGATFVIVYARSVKRNRVTRWVIRLRYPKTFRENWDDTLIVKRLS